ncbi:MAG: translocation/assembly module TamB domain-containing protein [Magnetococcales bacterium]|nr:translocation/assembly module TamB domain-containing protein [Magnetococcales bacterium]
MTLMRILSILQSLSLVLLALLCILVGTFLYALQTPEDMARLERGLNRLLASQEIPLTLRGMRVGWPLTLHVARLELTDSQGVWLAADAMDLTWSGSALVQGIVRVTDLQVGDLTWYRSPQSAPASTKTAASAQTMLSESILSLAAFFSALEVRQGRVERVHGLNLPHHAPHNPPHNPPVASLAEGSAPFSLQGAFTVPLRALAASTGASGPTWRLSAGREGLFTLAARGFLSADWTAQESTFDLSLPDLTPWRLSWGIPLAGSTRLTVQTRGVFQQTQVLASLDAGPLHLANLHTEQVHGRLESTLSLTDRATKPVMFKLTGTIGAWQREGVQGKAIPLTGQGTLDPTTRSATGTMVADLPDLAAWQALGLQAWMGNNLLTVKEIRTPQGQGRLGIDFFLAPGEKKIDLQARLALRNLRDGPPILMALAGTTPVLSARLTGNRQTGMYTLSDARLDGAALRLAGAATLHLPTRHLTADWQGELPDLRSLALPLGHPVAGRLQWVSRVDGSLDNPDVRLTILGDKLLWNRQPVDRLQARVEAWHLLDKPSGDLHLTAGFPGGKSLTEARFHLLDHAVEIPRLKLMTPAGTLEGHLHTSLPDGLTQGSLRGHLTSLASLAPLLDIPMTGKGELLANLYANKGQQQVTLRLDGQKLATPWGSAEKIHLDLQGDDLWKKAQLRGTLTATQGRRGDDSLEHLQATITGELNRLNVNLSAWGEVMQPFTLTSVGLIALPAVSPKGQRGFEVTIDQLTGTFGKDPLRLNTPLHFVQKKTLLDISPFDLSLGGARLAAHLHAEPKSLSGRLVFHLPLALATSRLDKPWAGEAEGSLDISGTADQPALAGVINLLRLHTTQPTWSNLPPLDAKMALALTGQTLRLSADLTHLPQGTLHLAGEMPVHLQLLPWRGGIASQATLTATLRTDFRLEQLTTLLAMPQQELEGRLQSDLRLDGALDHPNLSGTVSLTEGRYLHLEHGTELKNLRLEAQARDRTLTVTRLTADSGSRGQISGTGSVTLTPDSGFPLHADLELSQVTPLNNPVVVALADGHIRLDGPLFAPRIVGSIILGQTDILLAAPETEETESIAIEEQVNGVPLETTKAPSHAEESRPTLDLTIVSPGHLVTRGRGIDVDWSGEIRVTGDTSQPELRGLMQMRHGQVDFLGQRFQVARGTIQFTGTRPPNPITNLEAILQRKDLQATLHVQGPIRTPSLSFASDPPLAQDDIISNILFGRTTAEINPTQAASLALALRSLKEGSGSGFLDRFQQAIGISKLDFTPGDRPETGVVKVGKYLNDQIFLQVERGLAPGTGGVSVEMDMTPNLSLKTDMHEEKSQEIGINWKHQY